MTRAKMLVHAQHWIEGWNRRDVEAVLQAFAGDATFTSPKAASFVGMSRLEGRQAIADYWRRALTRISLLEFRLDHVTCDEQRREMVVFYRANLNGTAARACELMRFNQAGLQIFGEALYGATV